MKGVNPVACSAAATAFDQIAGIYDNVFTRSSIGRAQRKQVWSSLLLGFPRGSRLLELNCGTGEDSRFLAALGRSIVACDVSKAMIDIARERAAMEGYEDERLKYLQVANEELELLHGAGCFDGAFSNFSGLNCLDDIAPVAAKLAKLVRPQGRVLICLWSRLCLAEGIWFLLHGQPKKAIRRLWGKARARIGDIRISVSYPTVTAIRRAFSPWFHLESHRAVGLFVPPSYAEDWIRPRQKLLSWMEQMDTRFAQKPLLRNLGDHVLLEFVRCPH